MKQKVSCPKLGDDTLGDRLFLNPHFVFFVRIKLLRNIIIITLGPSSLLFSYYANLVICHGNFHLPLINTIKTK